MYSSAINNNLSFTSVVPVRVYIDGMETFNQKNIRTSCRQLSSVLAGPAAKDIKKTGIVKEYAKHDPDYILRFGLNGYPKLKGSAKKMQPSDYFRCISDDTKSYLFTGEQANKLREAGKAVGQEQQVCKNRHLTNSFDLHAAKKNYGFLIANYLRSTKLRLRETFDSFTKQRTGKPVDLNIHLTSNGKYAQSNFKIFLDKITFTPSNS